MTVKLVGHDDVALSGGGAANYLAFFKYVAVATGTATELHIRIKASTSGNLVAGIYADGGSNAPVGSPLAATAGTAVSSGAERSITVSLTSSCNITNGTTYWICVNQDASLIGYKTETADYWMKAYTYTGSLPSVPSGLTEYTTVNTIVAAWGSTQVDITVNAPTATASSAAPAPAVQISAASSPPVATVTSLGACPHRLGWHKCHCQCSYGYRHQPGLRPQRYGGPECYQLPAHGHGRQPGLYSYCRPVYGCHGVGAVRPRFIPGFHRFDYRAFSCYLGGIL